MDETVHAKMEARARILKALAHPSRLLIVDRLSRRQCCVAELTEMVGADMSTVSKHLTILRQAGIIRSRKQGTQVFHELAAACVMDFFGCLENIMQNSLQSDRDLLGKGS